MRLHWFREHKQIVYYVLCPAIVLSMTVFGMGSLGRNFFGGSSGPAVSYTVGTKEVYLSPAEVLQRRIVLYKFVNFYVPKSNQREDNPTTDNIGLFAAENESARKQGFEIGLEELKEFLRNAVKYKIMSIDQMSGEDLKVTPDLYEKLLAQLDMSSTQFETLIHNLALREKLHQNVMGSIAISDPQFYAKYCEDKETVRLRFQTFKSENFVKNAKQPTDDEIKKFYDENLDQKTGMQYKDIYMTAATLSVEALAYKDDKIFADIKAPTDAELKTTYDNNKAIHWQEPGKPGTFQPLEKVKAEVEKFWREDKMSALKRTVQDNVVKATKELADAETKFKADAANKDKTFDVAAFAKAHNMIHWVTPEQTEDKYSQGKLEVNAPDLILGSTILGFTRSSPNMPASARENQLKHMYEFTAFRWIDDKKPELGGIVARAKKYNEELTKTPEQAKDKIVEHLKILESAKLCREAAEKQHDAWRRGENLPKLEELDEITSDKKENHPLVRTFRSSQKAIGEVLDVAEGRPETEKFDFKDYDKKWCYVGCAVERKLPTLDGFKLVPEAEWSRDEARHGSGNRYQSKPGMIDEDYRSVLGLMVEQIKSNVIHVGNKESEPDVRTAYHDSRNNSDY